LFGLQWLRISVKELRSAPTQSVVVPFAGHFPWIERTTLMRKIVRVRGHEKVPTGGQIWVPVFGQLGVRCSSRVVSRVSGPAR
jgi:hypothetical protein